MCDYASHRVGVIRRDDPGFAVRETLAFRLLLPPPDHLPPARADDAGVALDPEPAQRLDRGDLAQPARRDRAVDLPPAGGTRPGRTARPVSARLALPSGRRKASIAARSPPARITSRITRWPASPARAAASASSAARTVSPASSSRFRSRTAQHMGGIGALPLPAAPTRPSAASRASSASSAPSPSRIGDLPGRNSLSTRVVEPRIIQLQAQAVLPVDPAPHRIGGLPVGQVLGALQHRHHRQLRRGDPRAPRSPNADANSSSPSHWPSRSRICTASGRGAFLRAYIAATAAAICGSGSGQAAGCMDTTYPIPRPGRGAGKKKRPQAASWPAQLPGSSILPVVPQISQQDLSGPCWLIRRHAAALPEQRRTCSS